MTRVVVAGLLALALVLTGCASMGESSERDQDASSANTQLGVELLRKGDTERALQKLNKAVDQDPRNSDAYMVRGLAFERLDKPDKAEASFSQSISLDGKNARALNNYGRFLCDRGEVDRALGLFKRSADVPTYEQPEIPLTNAGICLLRRDDDKAAEEYFRKALERNERQPVALLRMAELRLEREEYMAARGYYERYLSTAMQTAKSAWIGIRIERELGNEDALASYKQVLRNKFPDSEQAQKLIEWETDGRL